jgi:hypothetical protein
LRASHGLHLVSCTPPPPPTPPHPSPQSFSEVVTLCFALWGALCGYVRTLPKFTYAANVAAFSAGIIVFSVRTEPSGDAAVPVLARIQQVGARCLLLHQMIIGAVAVFTITLCRPGSPEIAVAASVLVICFFSAPPCCRPYLASPST